MKCPQQLLQAKVMLSAATLSNASVTFCVNGACHSGQLGQVDPSVATRSTLDNCTAVTVLPGVGDVVILFAPCDVATIVAGDILSLKIADSTGASLWNRSSTVTYTDENVCGETCHTLQLEF